MSEPGTLEKVPPGVRAIVFSIVLLAVGLAVAAAWDGTTKPFAPRVETLDALAGLSVGAFLVDRLINFVPPFLVRRGKSERAADLQMLRFGYGAILGMFFVSTTDLRAVKALTGSGPDIAAGLDRAVAVLAIAGGVAGLARLLSAVNPQVPTKDPSPEEDATTLPPPARWAYAVGLGAVGVGAVVALIAKSHPHAVNLLEPDKKADGTVALVVRFGTVFLAAAIVQQIAGFVLPPALFEGNKAANKRILTGALTVVLGVGAALLFHLFLLHNIGFFGVGPKQIHVLSGASKTQIWFDAFVTGIVIAAGTKPVHDFASRLSKAKKTT